MKKNITRNEWEYIDKYNPAAKWLRPICSYTLVETDSGFRRDCQIPLWLYIILFIPVHLAQALWCMWDGGLREFSFASRHLWHDYYYRHDAEYNQAYTRAKEIWERG